MKLFRLIATVALMAASTIAAAQTYPDKSRPIRLIVPFGAGSGTDLMARAYGRAMSEQAGVNVVVDNRPGAEGVIGIEAGKNAAPDGYTAVVGNLSTHVLNAHMLTSIPYDPVADFIPVVATENVMLVINAGPSTRFTTLKEVIEAARANPGKYSYGSGTASTRLCMELLEHLAGIKLLSVPYKAQAQATTALAAGEVDFLVTDVTTVQPFYSNGRVRPLATTGRDRLAVLPNVPTVREQGIKDYEFAAWHAVFVPARTPPEVVDKLRALLRDAARSKHVSDVIAAKASEPMTLETEQLKTLIRNDLDRWGKLLRDMKKSAR
jgi:tripartite-type tricarboxylate transporter receptor subunit TctC